MYFIRLEGDIFCPQSLGYYYLVAPHMYDPSRNDLIVVGAASFDENGFLIDEK
jgi:hypothetical protein